MASFHWRLKNDEWMDINVNGFLPHSHTLDYLFSKTTRIFQLAYVLPALIVCFKISGNDLSASLGGCVIGESVSASFSNVVESAFSLLIVPTTVGNVNVLVDRFTLSIQIPAHATVSLLYSTSNRNRLDSELARVSAFSMRDWKPSALSNVKAGVHDARHD